MLDRILELDAREFEVLVSSLLTAMGFEGSEVVGGPGDGGVDAKGVLQVANLAHIDLYVQAKRYAKDRTVSSNDIRKLRSMIPHGSQGAFITTGRFRKDAPDIALEPGFVPIGSVNGHRLVDLLVEHWRSIPQELQQQLGLKPGLVLS